MKIKAKKTNYPRKRFLQADINTQLEKQRGLCAYEDCKKIHGKRQHLKENTVNDHILMLALWNAWNIDGNPHSKKNIQILDSECERYKRDDDYKMLASYKRNKGNKKLVADIEACIRRSNDPRKIRICARKALYDYQDNE